MKRGKLLGVTRFGKKLAFWRDGDGMVHCISDVCCHRGASISHGEYLPNGRVRCPFHGFEYDGEGRVRLIPANGKVAPVPPNFRVKSYRVAEVADFIWVWYGEDAPNYEPSFFDDIDDSLTYAEFWEVWNVHYSRAIENQLDPVHLPFVHRNTIGRGNRTVVDGPVVRWLNDRMFVFYVFNRVDDGTPARRANEISIDEATSRAQVYLEFKFPNVWQNHIMDSMRVVAAFAPVDDDNTVIYLRYYVRFTKIKLIDKLIASLGNIFNKIVLHQDRRVVLTQIPKRSELVMEENLIPGDSPIIEYRKRRDALKRNAQLW